MSRYTWSSIQPMYEYTWSRIQFYAWIYLEQDTALCLGIPGVGYRSMYGCTWIQSYTWTRIHPFAWYTWSEIQSYIWVYLEQDTTLYLDIPGIGYNLLPRYTRRSIHGDGYSSMPGYTWSRIQPFTQVYPEEYSWRWIQTYARVYLEQDKTRSESRNLAFSISSLLLHLLKLNI